MSNDGLTINRYIGDDDIPAHEICLPTVKIQEGEVIDDNCFIGSYRHINLFTYPKLFMYSKPKISCKGITIPYEGNWKDLGNRYPIGKALKINDYFYEVVSISVSVDTDAVKDKSFIETDLYKADIKVKPYGINGHGDNLISIIFTPDPDIIKKW